MKSAFFLTLLLCLFSACKKSKKDNAAPATPIIVNDTPYSNWHIGKDSFSSNYVEYGCYHGGTCHLRSISANGFGLEFYYLYESQNKKLLSQRFVTADEIIPGFQLNDTVNYLVSDYNKSYADVKLINGKYQISFDSVWFLKYSNHNDSILVGRIQSTLIGVRRKNLLSALHLECDSKMEMLSAFCFL